MRKCSSLTHTHPRLRVWLRPWSLFHGYYHYDSPGTCCVHCVLCHNTPNVTWSTGSGFAILNHDRIDHNRKTNRSYPCFGLAAIFAGMLYNVQIIQKSSTRNIMHVNIIILKLPAKLREVID